MTESGDSPIVVADSSPLISLSAIGRLNLLPAIYGTVFVPPAVWDDVVTRGEGRAGARELADADWVRVVEVADMDRCRALAAERKINAGEAQAICAAMERPGTLLIVDERRARAVARSLEIAIVGTVGVLIQARRRRLVTGLGALVDEMRRKGIRLGDIEREAALREDARMAREPDAPPKRER